MVKHIGDNVAIVSAKELGTNCWLTRRFIEGTRCERVMRCTYPEKKTCKAVDAEIAYLRQERREAEGRFQAKMSELLAEKDA